MTARHPGMPDAFNRLRTSGWIISLCLHGTAIFLAGLFVAKIGLAPPSSLFHWDVTVIGPHAPVPTPTIGASPSTPAIVSKATRPAQRSAPITSGSPTSSQTRLPNKPAPASTAVTTEHLAAEPILTPHSQEPKQTLDRASAGPRTETHESAGEQSVSLHATPISTESPTESHPLQATTSPSIAEGPPASEPPSPSVIAEQTPGHSAAPVQTASLAPSAETTPAVKKPDYGWLAGPLLQRIEALKQYPAAARLNRLEGRVLVRIVIQQDGQIVSASIAKGSGHDVLDQAALETLRQASPITLIQTLERSPLTIQIPITYQLGR